MQIEGRTVVVTGASSGIGAATARAMGRAGAHVALVARTESALEAVADQIAARGGTATVIPADLSDVNAATAAAEEIRATVGPPDVLVNNAGIGRFLAIEETSPEAAVEMMAVPYFAAFVMTRAFVPAMLDRNAGHVVNVTSAAAYVPWPGSTAYATARWAMRGFSESLATDLHGTGVGVTLVAATTVESPYFEHNPGSRERLPTVARLFPTLTPEDVARAIVRGVESERRTVAIPRTFRAALVVHRLWPGLFRRLVALTGWSRPDD
jgi:short-subunit dehydrogenase